MIKNDEEEMKTDRPKWKEVGRGAASPHPPIKVQGDGRRSALIIISSARVSPHAALGLFQDISSQMQFQPIALSKRPK